jgi:hypothetical protein
VAPGKIAVDLIPRTWYHGQSTSGEFTLSYTLNLTGGSKVFTVPDTVYKKIDGFVDSVHNDGSSVGTTLTIGGIDAYFLFEPD